MRITLGINNCFAVKRWPQPEEWARIVAEDLGLAVVQHSLDLTDLGFGGGEAEAAAIRSAAAAQGLRIDSVFTGLIAYSTNLMLAPSERERERAADYWSRAVRFAALLGARTVGGHVGSLSTPDATNPQRRDLLHSELADRLADLAALGCRHGLDALLVENMACTREPHRMADIDELLREGDGDHCPVSLCLDVGHMCAPGMTGDDADPYAWLRRMGPRTSIVHLQQSDAHGDHHWPFTAEHNAAGRIDAARVLSALAESGVGDTTLILEVIPAFEADDARVVAELQESVMYWRDAMDDFRRAHPDQPQDAREH